MTSDGPDWLVSVGRSITLPCHGSNASSNLVRAAMNQTYKITASSPLLRPGLSISVEEICSGSGT